MTHEQAMALSAALVAEQVAHTVAVGYHEGMAPPTQCRVDVPLPRSYRGGLADRMVLLEQIGAAHGMVLHTGFMGDGLTYSTEPQETWPGRQLP